jgi:hypothetical protein
MIHTKKDEKILADLIKSSKLAKLDVSDEGTLREIVTHVMKVRDLRPVGVKTDWAYLGIERAL